MAKPSLKMSTLAWLDRRRLWATVDRKTSLGSSRLQSLPSSLGGQGTRPTVAYRTFEPSYPFIFSTLGVGLVALLTLIFFACTALFLGGLSLAKSLFLADNFFNSEKPKSFFNNPFGPRQRIWGAPQQPSLLPLSLLGATDSLEALAGGLKTSPATVSNKGWVAHPLLRKGGLWGPYLNKLGRSNSTFRPYLGEWRRQYEQRPLVRPLIGGGKPMAPALESKRRGGVKTPSPLILPFYSGSSIPLKPASQNLPKAYSPHLTSSWSF